MTTTRWPLRALLLIALAASILVAPPVGAGRARAATGWWRLAVAARPTYLQRGGSEQDVLVYAENVGDAPIDGSASPIAIEDTLPPGISVDGTVQAVTFPKQAPGSCTGSPLRCTFGEDLAPYEAIEVLIPVKVASNAPPGRPTTVTASGGEVPGASLAHPLTVSGEPVPFGIESYDQTAEEEGGAPARKASGHPFQLTTHLAFNQTQDPTAPPALPRGVASRLPAGLIGNVTSMPQCSALQFNTYPTGSTEVNACPPESAVGVAIVTFYANPIGVITGSVPIFNLAPGRGEPARFGFEVIGSPVIFDASVRSGSDYGVTVRSTNIPQGINFISADTTFWGVPGDARHDASRGWQCLQPQWFPAGACGAAEAPPDVPLLRMPTACAANPAAEPLTSALEAESWLGTSAPALTPSPVSYTFLDEAGGPLGLTGCQSEPFEPSLQLTPESRRAASPTGLVADVHIPQEAAENPEGTAPSDLKDTTVVLPKGISVNPSSANGLGACSEAQIGYKPGTSEPAEFSPGPAECPDASKIGTVEIKTPLLDHPLGSPGGPAGNLGAVYVAEPHENPFDSLLAIYVAVNDPLSGTVVKLPGEVSPDPQTGQLTSTFAHTPQLPFEDFTLRFFGGPRAALKTPDTCGAFTTHASFTPWSGTPPVSSDPAFQITEGPGGGACPSGQPNSPAFSAGTLTPLAGQFSLFVLHLSREDGSQEFSKIDTVLPEGLVGRLAGTPYCPDAALAAAAAKSGREEQAAPSCPAASRVGTVTVGAGAGSQPYYTQGAAYLAGPYKGAPLSMAIVTPAVAGPYDLGNVVVRVALHVNPETAQITATSDPIPHILQGIPLDVRSIALRLDKPDFTLNPTSCEEAAITGAETSVQGSAASLSSRFQVAECAKLKFKPKLGLRLFGKTNRGAHPKFKAVLRMKGGEANIARAAVRLPQSEILDQGHIRTICTRVQFAAGGGNGERCPKGAVYGHAKAWTPLLDEPLSGPVFLRSSNHNLPDLVVALHGIVNINLDARIDSVHGGIRSTFARIPDAPVSRFVLAMQGGKKGLIINSRNLCFKPKRNRANARLRGQNGRLDRIKPVVRAVKCGRHKRHKRHHKRRAHKRARR